MDAIRPVLTPPSLAGKMMCRNQPGGQMPASGYQPLRSSCAMRVSVVQVTTTHPNKSLSWVRGSAPGARARATTCQSSASRGN